ncbi:MAG: hypothetical protein PHW58_01745 [Candidatus Methanofastidiosa archaeon]|jgi:uncharacterized membrane protein YdcZ (DUF606 family)|nr:hypothetical protein [Candidatus Methanofastidiosa archaeon]
MSVCAVEAVLYLTKGQALSMGVPVGGAVVGGCVGAMVVGAAVVGAAVVGAAVVGACVVGAAVVVGVCVSVVPELMHPARSVATRRMQSRVARRDFMYTP